MKYYKKKLVIVAKKIETKNKIYKILKYKNNILFFLINKLSSIIKLKFKSFSNIL